MPTREGIQHFVDTSEPTGVQPGDEWWNIGTGRYYKRVVFSNGGVGWTEIAQPSLVITSMVGAANTWALTQAFNGGITGTTAAFSGGITGTTAAFNGLSIGTNALVPSASAVSLTLPSSAGTLALTSQIVAPSTLLSSANTWTAYQKFPPLMPATTLSYTQMPNSQFTSFVTQGNLLYGYLQNISGAQINFVIYDITDPSSPTQLYNNNNGGGYQNYLCIQGSYLYGVRSQSPNYLNIWNVSDPTAPTLVSSTSLPVSSNQVGDILIDSNYVYICHQNTNTIFVYDVTNPASPTLISQFSTGASTLPTKFVLKNEYLFVTMYNSNELRVYNVANPANITQVGSVSTGAGSNPYGIDVQDKYAYVACASTPKLNIYNISTPSSPTAVSGGTITLAAAAYTVKVFGNYAYVGSIVNSGSIHVIDISNVSSPSAFSTITTAFTTPFQTYGNSTNFTLYGRYLITNTSGLAGVYLASLQIYDVGTMYSHTIEAGSIKTRQFVSTSGGTFLGNVDVRGGGIYASDGVFADRFSAISTRTTSSGASINSLRIVALDTSSTASIIKTGFSVESTGTWNGTSAINRALYATATGGTSNYAAIFDQGNVGIGTSSPGSTLDVKGTLRLSGSTSGYVGFAPAAAAGSATYTLPSAAPSVNGQALTSTTGGAMSWTTISGGSSGRPYTYIGSVTVSGTAATMSFTSIAATYTDLYIRFASKIDGTSTQYVMIRFNADTATNYQSGEVSWGGSNLNNVYTGLAYIIGGRSTASTVAQTISTGEFIVADYANTSFDKMVFGHLEQAGEARVSGPIFWDISGKWNNTAAITAVSLTPFSGNFVTGSYAYLYGRSMT